MASDESKYVTAEDAAHSLRRPAATIRVWAHRYSVPRIRRRGRGVRYDLHDLQVIERELWHGHEVPKTPEERAAIRLHCPLRAAEPGTETQRAA